MANEIEKKFLLSENGERFIEQEGLFLSDPESQSCICADRRFYHRIFLKATRDSLVDLVDAYNALGNDFVQKVLSYWPQMREFGQKANILTQGYLPIEVGKFLANQLGLQIEGDIAEARIRRKHSLETGVDSYVFTAKSDGTISRQEYESAVDKIIYENAAKQFIGVVDKIRLKFPLEEMLYTMSTEEAIEQNRSNRHAYFHPTAEIDFYRDRNLVTAEVECPSIEVAERLPSLGKDITENKAYKNKNLALPL